MLERYKMLSRFIGHSPVKFPVVADGMAAVDIPPIVEWTVDGDVVDLFRWVPTSMVPRSTGMHVVTTSMVPRSTGMYVVTLSMVPQSTVP